MSNIILLDRSIISPYSTRNRVLRCDRDFSVEMLQGAWVFGGLGGNQFRNLVNGKLLTTQNNTPFTYGIKGGAVAPSGAYCISGLPSALFPHDFTFVVTLWLSGSTTTNGLVDKKQGGQCFRYQSPGNLHFLLSGVVDIATNNTTLPTNRPITVALSWKGTSYWFAVDGKIDGSGTYSNGNTIGGSNLTIVGDDYDGTSDHTFYSVLVYNRGMTPAELQVITADPLRVLSQSPISLTTTNTTVHKYWRLNITENNGAPSNTSLAEIEFRGSVGGADQCSGGTATTSSYWGSYPPSNAFDNNVSNIWVTVAAACWIKYEFTDPVNIAQYVLTSREAYLDNTPKAWTLEYSDDDSTWTVFHTVTDQTNWGVNESRTFVIGQKVSQVLAQVEWQVPNSQKVSQVLAQVEYVLSGGISGSISEQVTLSETVTSTAIYQLSISEQVSCTDTTQAINTAQYVPVSITDTITNTDVNSFDFRLQAVIAEVVSHLESLTGITGDIHVTISESLGISDLAYRVVVYSMGLSDVVTLSEITSYIPAYMISELFWVTTLVAVKQHLHPLIYDGTFIYDTALPARAYLTGLAEEITTIDKPSVGFFIVLSDFVECLSTIQDKWNCSIGVSDSTTVSDIITSLRMFQKSLTESVNMAGECSRIFVAAMLAQEMVSLSESITPRRDTNSTCSDYISVSCISNLRGVLAATVEDMISFAITISINGEEYQCWSFTTDKFLPSLYTNYDFNSYTIVEGEVYGCKTDGIYKLTGGYDNNSVIESGVDINYDCLDIYSYKRIHYAYFGLIGDCPAVRVTSEMGEYDYYIIDGRAKFGRGLESRSWELKITNIDSIDFIEFFPVILTRG